jgi:glycosyltransferase involved in cell wall biosynthesis
MIEPVTLSIPYYSDPQHLRAAIESVLVQDDDQWQLIVLDDSERDEARKTIESMGLAQDPRVQCIQNPRNLGMVGNWNACLDATTTPLGTLLHADDALEPHYVSMMRDLATAHPDASAFFCEARIIDAGGQERFSFADWIKRFYLPANAIQGAPFTLRGEDGLRALMAGNFIMCPTLCYRVAALAGRRFDAHYQQVQDLDFTSRLLMDGDTLVGSRERAYAYRRHANAATARQSASLLRFDEEFSLFESISARAVRLGWDRAAAVASRKTIIRLHLVYRAMGELLHLRLAGAARCVKRAYHRGPGRA